eukprot:sb/3463775/
MNILLVLMVLPVHPPIFVFVGGLPYHTSDQSLREFFNAFGEIEEAVVIHDRATGKSKGYGFVTMVEADAASKAVANPTPIIDGRKANVNLAYLGAKPRPKSRMMSRINSIYVMCFESPIQSDPDLPGCSGESVLPGISGSGKSGSAMPSVGCIGLRPLATNSLLHPHAQFATATAISKQRIDCQDIGLIILSHFCYKLEMNVVEVVRLAVSTLTNSVAMVTVFFERGEKNHPAKPGGLYLSERLYLRRTQWVVAPVYSSVPELLSGFSGTSTCSGYLPYQPSLPARLCFGRPAPLPNQLQIDALIPGDVPRWPGTQNALGAVQHSLASRQSGELMLGNLKLLPDVIQRKVHHCAPLSVRVLVLMESVRVSPKGTKKENNLSNYNLHTNLVSKTPHTQVAGRPSRALARGYFLSFQAGGAAQTYFDANPYYAAAAQLQYNAPNSPDYTTAGTNNAAQLAAGNHLFRGHTKTENLTINRNRPKQLIRTSYLGHVTGYQPTRDQYFLFRSTIQGVHMGSLQALCFTQVMKLHT